MGTVGDPSVCPVRILIDLRICTRLYALGKALPFE
jgi:hypothetical protein